MEAKFHLLHFCSYYYSSKVYKNLFSRLANNPINQKVYVPYRSSKAISAYQLDDERVEFQYMKCLFWFTRLFYSLKILLVLISSTICYRKDKFHCVHAHTLYADAVPAFFICFLRKIPLIITVRNTDVNLGFKVFFHYKWLLKIVLRYATTVVVVSPTYKDRIIEYFGIEFSNKIQIIPNGLETEFIANALLEKRATAICSGLFVGKIDSNKNLERSILAFSNAMKCIGRDDWSFRVVGGTEKEYNAIYMKLSAELREKVSFMGQVNDKNELISFYDISSLFIMPSFKETFGLVYLEAISRCVPVIYSKNQGIDGVFKEGEVGMRCEPHNLDSISESILQTLQLHPEGLGPFKSNPVSAFSWEEVAFRHYSKLYAPAFKCTKL